MLSSQQDLHHAWRWLDQSLATGRKDWQSYSFSRAGIAAQQHHLASQPALQAALTRLTEEEVEDIDANPAKLAQFFAPYLPCIEQAPTLLAVLLVPDEAAVDSPPVMPLPFWLTNGIQGRKLEQIRHFIAALPTPARSSLEWCAGKGHLGRLLAFHNAQQNVVTSVVSAELQAELCTAGMALAKRHDVNQRFVQQDVLADDAHRLLQGVQQGLALHACGGLHQRLITLAAQQGTAELHIAPCCYHLHNAACYQPMSAMVRAESLMQLTRADLKLAVQGQVTGGQRVGRLRRQEVTWRLAWQLWHEQSNQTTEYQPLPALPKQLLSADFSAFCVWAEQLKPTPRLSDSPTAQVEMLEQAEQLYLDIKRADLLRHAYRRMLELWLVLDRALYLTEQGYETHISSFCHYQLTPRNILISAHLKT